MPADGVTTVLCRQVVPGVWLLLYSNSQYNMVLHSVADNTRPKYTSDKEVRG